MHLASLLHYISKTFFFSSALFLKKGKRTGFQRKNTIQKSFKECKSYTQHPHDPKNIIFFTCGDIAYKQLMYIYVQPRGHRGMSVKRSKDWEGK